MTKYIYENFNFSDEYKEELIEFLKHNTNSEIGGYRIHDGAGTHLMQNPYELSEFIFALKDHEKVTGRKLSKFLEIGFHAGINNTIINKFFNFDEVVAIDIFRELINGYTLRSNMTFKNLTLISGDSTSERVLNITKLLGGYDLIFIDGNHNYEYVKQDFYNVLPLLNDGGVIGFHDVDCPDWPGIKKFWNELLETGKYNQTAFVKHGYLLRYGIGMLTLK